MTIAQAAFEETLAADKEFCGGVQQQIWLGGQPYDAVISLMTASDLIIAGCVSESGGFKAMVRTSVPIPTRYTLITGSRPQGDMVLRVLGSNQNDGYTEIQVADLSAPQ